MPMATKQGAENWSGSWEKGEQPILDFCTYFLLTRKRGQPQHVECQEAIIHRHTHFFSWLPGDRESGLQQMGVLIKGFLFPCLPGTQIGSISP